MSNTSTLQQDFKKNGYILIKDFFSKNEIEKLVAAIRAVSDKKTHTDVLDVGNLKFHAQMMHKSKTLRQFISQPKIIDFLAKFMGPDIWVRWDQAVEKKPGAGLFPWHTDNSYSFLKDAHFQFWISLTKMTKDNGGIWLMPGTHKKNIKHTTDGNHTVAIVDGIEDTFINADIGDIVLFSSKLLHSTTPNITNESRWAYVVEYMKAKHIDPFIAPPYLTVAKKGKPALAYVDELPSAKSFSNRIKYWKENLQGQTYTSKK